MENAYFYPFKCTFCIFGSKIPTYPPYPRGFPKHEKHVKQVGRQFKKKNQSKLSFDRNGQQNSVLTNDNF